MKMRAISLCVGMCKCRMCVWCAFRRSESSCDTSSYTDVRNVFCRGHNRRVLVLLCCSRQLERPSENVVADVASVWLLVGVSFFVVVQGGPLREGISAHFALIWLSPVCVRRWLHKSHFFANDLLHTLQWCFRLVCLFGVVNSLQDCLRRCQNLRCFVRWALVLLVNHPAKSHIYDIRPPGIPRYANSTRRYDWRLRTVSINCTLQTANEKSQMWYSAAGNSKYFAQYSQFNGRRVWNWRRS